MIVGAGALSQYLVNLLHIVAHHVEKVFARSAFDVAIRGIVLVYSVSTTFG